MRTRSIDTLRDMVAAERWAAELRHPERNSARRSDRLIDANLKAEVERWREAHPTQR